MIEQDLHVSNIYFKFISLQILVNISVPLLQWSFGRPVSHLTKFNVSSIRVTTTPCSQDVGIIVPLNSAGWYFKADYLFQTNPCLISSRFLPCI